MGVEQFAQKVLASFSNFYETVEKKGGSYDALANIGPSSETQGQIVGARESLQNGRCEKLEASLYNKDKEINALKMKIVSLETRASSAKQENDSRKLALKLIMQEMSVGERQQQRNQSY